MQASRAVHDTDNLKLSTSIAETVPIEFTVKDVLAAGQCFDVTGGAMSFPNGLQLTLGQRTAAAASAASASSSGIISDTLVMQNLGYWQLKAQPGVFSLALAPGRASQLYSIVQSGGASSSAENATSGGVVRKRLSIAAASSASGSSSSSSSGMNFFGRRAGAAGSGSSSSDVLEQVPSLDVAVRSFTGPITQLLVRKKAGKESESLLSSIGDAAATAADGGAGGSSSGGGVLSSLKSFFGSGSGGSGSGDKQGSLALPGEEVHPESGKPVVHVFSLASGECAVMLAVVCDCCMPPLPVL